MARSDRVKCMDLHPKEPWMLASLYNGNVHVWNYESQTLVKSFEVTDLPGEWNTSPCGAMKGTISSFSACI